MDYVRFANGAPQAEETGLAQDPKRVGGISDFARCFLRHDGHIEFQGTVRLTALGKSKSQGKNNGLNAADAGGEKVGIDQKFHVKFF